MNIPIYFLIKKETFGPSLKKKKKKKNSIRELKKKKKKKTDVKPQLFKSATGQRLTFPLVWTLEEDLNYWVYSFLGFLQIAGAYAYCPYISLHWRQRWDL